MGEAWRGRCVSPSILTGRTTPRRGSPVNYYGDVTVWSQRISDIFSWSFDLWETILKDIPERVTKSPKKLQHGNVYLLLLFQ